MNAVNNRGYIREDALNGRFMVKITEHLSSFFGYESKELGVSETTYTMWYNFVLLNFYYLTLIKLDELACLNINSLDDNSSNELADLVDDLHHLREVLLSRFDQYLRFQIQKRGVTVIQNTYTGFDTEYQLDNPRKNINRLLSLQTAVQRRTIIKVPLYNPYDISYVHPLSSEISNIYKNKVDLHDSFKYTFIESYDSFNVQNKKSLNELKILNNGLKLSISKLRKLLFQSVDEANSSILNILKNIRGVEFFEDLKHDQIVFIFPLTKLHTQFILPQEGKINFIQLLEMTKELNCDEDECRNKENDNDENNKNNKNENEPQIFGQSLRNDFIYFLQSVSAIGISSEVSRLIN